MYKYMHNEILSFIFDGCTNNYANRFANGKTYFYWQQNNIYEAFYYAVNFNLAVHLVDFLGYGNDRLGF